MWRACSARSSSPRGRPTRALRTTLSSSGRCGGAGPRTDAGRREGLEALPCHASPVNEERPPARTDGLSRQTRLERSQGMPSAKRVTEPTDDMLARFMAKVEMHESGCWLWTGSMRQGGYGQFAVNRFPRPAHRVALWMFRGVQLGGDRVKAQADHLCRVRRCVNPEHLEMVSQVANTRRAHGLSDGTESTCGRGHVVDADGVCRACRRFYEGKRNRSSVNPSRNYRLNGGGAR